MSLSFDEDLRRHEISEKENKAKSKKFKKRKNAEEPNQEQPNERKKSKKELMSKTREEVIFFEESIDCFICVVDINVVSASYRLLLTTKPFHLPQILKRRNGCNQRFFRLCLRHTSEF